MDSLGCGYPDISYHGAEAWRPDLSFVSRLVNIFFFVEGMRMRAIRSFILHIICIGRRISWHFRSFRRLFAGKRILSTEEDAGGEALKEMEADNGQVIESRSIAVYQTESSSK